jgi:hypothetical protein
MERNTMDWKTVLVNEQHQRDLIRQAKNDRMARTLPKKQHTPRLQLLRTLATAVQRPQVYPQTNVNTPRVYTSAEQS